MTLGQPAPAVSVVVPSYQAAWSIERTIRSVQAQRMADFELIVVDDGSTDDLLQRVAPLAAADPRIRVVSQPNRGLAGARNRGVAEARAALVAPLDADDLWHPDFLAACVAALEGAPEAPFAYAYSLRIDVDDRVLPFASFARPPRHDLLGLLTLNSVGNGSAAVFRRGALLAAGGYDEAMRAQGLHGAEDWKLILRLARTAPPVLVPRHLVGYRMVPHGMSRGNPARQWKAVQEVLAQFRSENPHLPEQAFRDASTMMTAWLLPVFIRRGAFVQVLRLMGSAYLANPRWIANRNLRLAHRAFALRLLKDGVARLRGAKARGVRFLDGVARGPAG